MTQICLAIHWIMTLDTFTCLVSCYILGRRVAAFQGPCGCMTLLTLTVGYGVSEVSSNMTEVTIRYSIVWGISLYGSWYKSTIVSMTSRTVLSIVMVLPSRCYTVCLVMIGLAVTGITDVLRIGRSI